MGKSFQVVEVMNPPDAINNDGKFSTP